VKLAGLRARLAGLFTEADQSYDDKRRAIDDALGEFIQGRSGSNVLAPYAYAEDVFDDYFIFSADLDGDGDRDLYKMRYSIGDDGDADFIGDPVEVKKTTTYEPVTDDEAGESKRPKTESLAEVELSELTMLTEKAIKADGSALIKIIQPGWGSSGYYGKPMLERDGAKAFPSGTKMYLDHPTKTEERERPERSVTNLSAELTGAASYLEGSKAPHGDGLYAPAKIFTAHREMLEDLAPHIGVSIRALGRTGPRPETIEGRTGPVIEQLVSAKSIDFVTEPGAGGAIVSLFESARGGAAYHRTTTVKDVTAPRAGKETTVAENTDLAQVLKEIAELKEANRKRDERERDGDLVLAARTFAVEEVSHVRLPKFVRERIVRDVTADPPVKDGALDRDAFKKQITEAVKSEAEYLVRITGRGTITGLGASISETVDPAKAGEKAKEDLKESFIALGLTDKMADKAVAVRN
jgi:hypothetical protein